MGDLISTPAGTTETGHRPPLAICDLYGDLLNIYGDRGNLISLVQRARWHGYDPQVQHVGVGDVVDFTNFDLLVMGGGQDREQSLLSRDFRQVKGQSLAEAVEAGVPMLTICAGYQMMGHYYRTHEGEEIPGMGILDLHTEAGKVRFIGNLLSECEFLPGPVKTLVGFENHSGRTYLGGKVRPLGKVKQGSGNNGEDGTEGVVYKGVIGSYLHGSLLPKNPHLADYLLGQAVQRRYGAMLGTLPDELEWAAHKAMVARLA
jgi:CobQ-like glutamine amidotransferase family enzyme